MLTKELGMFSIKAKKHFNIKVVKKKKKKKNIFQGEFYITYSFYGMLFEYKSRQRYLQEETSYLI